MANPGTVLVDRHAVDVGPFALKRERYLIEGGPLYYLDSRSARPRAPFRTIGPYRFRVVGYSVEALAEVGILDRWWWRPYLAGYRLCGALRWLKPRVIATAAVWGLARMRADYVLTWPDIHAVRWCAWAAANCGLVDPRDCLRTEVWDRG